jgi:hypothetical protein
VFPVRREPPEGTLGSARGNSLAPKQFLQVAEAISALQPLLQQSSNPFIIHPPIVDKKEKEKNSSRRPGTPVGPKLDLSSHH